MDTIKNMLRIAGMTAAMTIIIRTVTHSIVGGGSL